MTHSGSSRLWRTGIVCVSILLAGADRSSVAQRGFPSLLDEPSPAPQNVPTIRVNARLVVLDVSATDSAGKPITGLTAADFRVYEDKTPQQIRSFEPPSAHSLPVEAGQEGASAVFDAARPLSFGSSPVTILLLDQLNTHFADSSYARRQLHDYLAKQPVLLAQPATLLTLYQNRFKQLAGFTRERDALLKALAAAPVEYAWTLEVNGKAEHGPIERLQLSLNALEDIAQSYASIRGRKNLIWVGNGFPGVDPGTLSGPDNEEVQNTLKHVTDVLLDTRVTLYAIDPTSTLPGMTEITDTTQQQFVLAGGDSLSGSMDTFGFQDDFDKLGLVSGGSVIRGRNDISALIATAIKEGSEYYTLSYSPTAQSNESAAYRKIRVECLRPGCVAHTRDGYFPGVPAKPDGHPETDVATDLSAAAESQIALHGLQVTTDQTSATADQEQRFAIHVSAPGLTWKPQEDGSSKADVYVMFVSLDKNGKMIAHQVSSESAAAKAGINLTDASKSATFVMQADPTAKAVTLRFVVRDASSGYMGTVDLPVVKR